MELAKLLDTSATLCGPPPGSINVLVGTGVEGPGGRWIPCATAVPSGTYLSSIFEVGPGRKQVCASMTPMRSADEALSRAIALAATAAA